MKLSEAILLGSTLAPQGFWRFMNSDGHTCAVGAALQAVGAELSDVSSWEQFPILNTVGITCPECGRKPSRHPMYYLVSHINDYHRWSREKIAEWVATVEADLEPVPEPIKVIIEEECFETV
jgi:hypothetical protein